jgi:ATP-dependent DNA helicase RecG
MRERMDSSLREDLRLRGTGEVLERGNRLPQFRLADLSVHGDLLAAA